LLQKINYSTFLVVGGMVILNEQTSMDLGSVFVVVQCWVCWRNECFQKEN